MKNFSFSQFPQARLERMAADAATFDPRNFRADSLTPTAAHMLRCIDPTLDFLITSGNDAAARTRQDASESVFYARQLEHIRPGLLETLYPEFEGKAFVPCNTSIPAGAEFHTVRVVNKVGRAQLIKNYGSDLPTADLTGGEVPQVIRGAGIMYRYTTQELRAAMMAGIPLDTAKAMSARYALALLLDEVMFYGKADVNAGESATGLDAGMLNSGLTGLVTLANTTGFTTPTGAQGSKLWRRKTADEMVLDLNSFVNNVVRSTLGIHRPNAIRLPLAAYNIATTKRMGDGSDMTVLKHFMAVNPYIKEVTPSYRLDAAQSENWNGTSSPTTGRAIAYETKPDRVECLLPLEFEQLPPVTRHFTYETACHFRTGGVVGLYPRSISYMDDITDVNDL